MDKKLEYLIKTFSRTNKKDYENYILTGIWHRLNRLDIKPVTQQYVKLIDGTYSLIDLYFPQINLGVECDEEYHKNNKEKDFIREFNLSQVLSKIVLNDEFKLIRIDTTKNIEEIEKQIDDAVFCIKSKLQNTDFEKWDMYKTNYEIISKKGDLRVSDNLEFSTIAEIANCFGRGYKALQTCFLKLNEHYSLWCPKIYINKTEIEKTKFNGWYNTLSPDLQYIHETNVDLNKLYNLDERQRNSKDLHRLVFVQDKNIFGKKVYKFVGIFNFVEIKNNSRIFKSIGDRIIFEKDKFYIENS
ncbi:MAG: hypothetical protein KIC92_01255 [Clostridiales bacterium]|nr:hypothetical protein [Clostridiales bacterium]